MLRSLITQRAFRAFGRASIKPLPRTRVLSTTSGKQTTVDLHNVPPRAVKALSDFVKLTLNEGKVLKSGDAVLSSTKALPASRQSDFNDRVWATKFLVQVGEEALSKNGLVTRVHCAPGKHAGGAAMMVQALLFRIKQPVQIKLFSYDQDTVVGMMVFHHLMTHQPEKVRWINTKGYMLRRMESEYPDLWAACEAKIKIRKTQEELTQGVIDLVEYFTANWTNWTWRRAVQEMVQAEPALVDREIRRRLGDMYGALANDLGFLKPGPGNKTVALRCLAGRALLLGDEVCKADRDRAAKVGGTPKADLLAAASYT